MVQIALTYKATIFFPIDTVSGILLRIMVFLVMGRSAENVEEKNKTDRRKTLKSEEKEKRRIRGESNSNNRNL